MTTALVHARALLSIKKINNNNNNKFWWKLDNYITNYITSQPQIAYELIEPGEAEDILQVQGLSYN